LLPNRSDPITYADLARAILGFLGSDTHKDASEAVQRFCDFACMPVGPDFDPDFSPGNLLEAMIIALQPPYRIFLLEINATDQIAKLYVVHNRQSMQAREYCFFNNVPDRTKLSVFPVSITRSIRSELILRLLCLLEGNTSTNVEPKTTTAAEAPPSRGRQPKATQTARRQPKPLNKAKATRTLTSASKPSVRSDLPCSFNRTLDL